jgi:pyruvate/2-oxoglutarate dehydrogenase complex dihydrolipoamide dehydrogenase (E3) component
MQESKRYDAIVVGSGQGGNPLSMALAKAGKKTALIERQYIGGTCVNYGCTPTKTMFNSARVAYLSRRSSDYGVHTGPVSVNMAEVRARKQGVVQSFRDGGLRGIEGTSGLDLLKGEACFTGAHSIDVQLKDGGTVSLTADNIVINTGGRPAKPDLAGAENISFLDSTSIMELDEVPEHLLVMGGGYIGLEFGQMFRRYGSQVTIVQRSERLLNREDDDVADELAKILREDGITLFLKAGAVSVAQSGGVTSLTMRTADGEQTLTGSHLLVATGRTPNTEDLNLAAAGIETDKHGFIRVNDRLETNVPGVYAIGDVKGGPQFTHISYDDYRIMRTNLIEGGDATVKDRMVPYTVFIDPQLGRVGLTEADARARGCNVRIARLPMTSVARAIEMSETRGFIKAVVDAETKLIVGCSVLGVEGGELMAMIQVAMMGGVSYTKLRDAIFAHPTLAESLNNLFAKLEE